MVPTIRALTSLDLSDNNIGAIVGWTYHPGNIAIFKYKHSDGRHQEQLPVGDELGKPEGVIAIANAIPTMGALVSLDLSRNGIPQSESSGIKAVCEAKGISLKI